MPPCEHNEGLQVALRIGQVAKQIPAYGALAAAKDPHRVHRLNEIVRPLS
jgi:hypothetical protein